MNEDLDRTVRIVTQYYPERLPLIFKEGNEYSSSQSSVSQMVPSDYSLGTEVGDIVSHKYGILTHLQGDMLLVDVREGFTDKDVEVFFLTGKLDSEFSPISITSEDIHHEIKTMIEDGELELDDFLNASDESSLGENFEYDDVVFRWITRCIIRAMQSVDFNGIVSNY